MSRWIVTVRTCLSVHLVGVVMQSVNVQDVVDRDGLDHNFHVRRGVLALERLVPHIWMQRRTPHGPKSAGSWYRRVARASERRGSRALSERSFLHAASIQWSTPSTCKPFTDERGWRVLASAIDHGDSFRIRCVTRERPHEWDANRSARRCSGRRGWRRSHRTDRRRSVQDGRSE